MDTESETAEQIHFETLNIDSNDSKTETEEAESANTPAKDEKIREAEEEEKEYLEKDPIARSQFNYNQSTCFGDNHPEIAIEENTMEETAQVAPGQGKIPRSLLCEEDFEVKVFPCFFPDGKNGKDQTRNVKISDQDYWVQRILNVDGRLSTICIHGSSTY